MKYMLEHTGHNLVVFARMMRDNEIPALPSDLEALKEQESDGVADTYPLRFLTVLEAASGLAVFTAAISFILGLFPGLISLRSQARRFHDLGLTDPSLAAQHALGDQSVIHELHQAMLDEQHQRKRFPVQLLFTEVDPADAVPTIFRCAIVTSLAGQAIGPSASHRCTPEALDASLARTMSEYEGALLRDKHGSTTIGETEVERSLAIFCRAAGYETKPSPEGAQHFSDLLRSGALFIEKLDRAFLYDPTPLVPELRPHQSDTQRQPPGI